MTGETGPGAGAAAAAERPKWRERDNVSLRLHKTREIEDKES